MGGGNTSRGRAQGRHLDGGSVAERVAKAAEVLVAIGTGGALREDQAQVAAEEFLFLYSMGTSLAAHRREHPGDDLMTNLVQAEIDGERLTDDHIGQFMVLMAVAGNDTTKQTTTSAMLALQRHPEQPRPSQRGRWPKKADRGGWLCWLLPVPRADRTREEGKPCSEPC